MFAMRPALCRRQIRVPAEMLRIFAVPTGIAAMLLRSWMAHYG